jgi:hypothetical protein
MKPRYIIGIVLVALAAGCGGGGGEGDAPPAGAVDTMTVSVWSSSTGTTTATYGSGGAAATFFGSVVSWPAPTVTSVTMNNAQVQVVVAADGVTAGAYPITGNLTTLMVRYTLYTTPSTTDIYATDASGTITLTGVGAVNEAITGNFNATVFKTFPVSDPTDSLRVSGTFSAKRWF